MKMMILYFVATILISSSTLKAEDAKKQENEMVKRKVIILNFVNQNYIKKYDYLSQTIPDSMNTALSKTKMFTILRRDVWKKAMQKQKIKEDELNSEDKAIELAKLSGADVVVMGSYVVIGDNIKINSYAIDVISGQQKVARSARGSTGVEIFDVIDTVCLGMANEMKKELPPMKQRIIIKKEVVEKKIYVDGKKKRKMGSSNFYFQVDGGFGLPLDKNLRKAFNIGARTDLGFIYYVHGVENLKIGLFGAFNYFKGAKTSFENSSEYMRCVRLITVPVYILAGYRLKIGNKFFITPALGIGILFNYLKLEYNIKNSGGEYDTENIKSRDMFISVAPTFGYQINRVIGIIMEPSLTLFFERKNSENLVGAILNVTAGMQIRI